MTHYLIAFALIILICVYLNRVSSRIGVPVLLLFIMVGMCFGLLDPSVVTLKRAWLVERVCTIALIFIMFYGGFGTSWKKAKDVAKPSALLATVGVFITAGITGLFCHLILRWGWAESFLMGAVVSSTDAATVFSILRGKRMGLKNGTASMLEIESGSNDPCSYMLTAIMISVINGQAGAGMVVWTIIAQLAFGFLGGGLIAHGAVVVMRRWPIKASGFSSMYLFAVAMLAYALPMLIGGNGYLSAYIVGIILGNTDFEGKKQLVGFFDGITSLMQILIFFLLGLMAQPASLVKAFLPATLIFLCLLLIARPAAVASILVPYGKYPLRQIGLVSFVGLRGAASIVFAIMTLTQTTALQNDIFSVVFCIVLISLLAQGTLIPHVAKMLKMTDRSDVMQTFSDFSDNVDASFGSIRVKKDDRWDGKTVRDLPLPRDMIMALIVREGKRVVPKGDTVLRAGDEIVMCLRECDQALSANIYEKTVSDNSKSVGHRLSEIHDPHSLILMIKRGPVTFIPNGNTILKAGDKLVILKNK